MTQSTTTQSGYTFRRGKRGVDDVFYIEDSNGECLFRLHFWNEPDTIEAALAEFKAQMIVAALNLPCGGWVETSADDDE